MARSLRRSVIRTLRSHEPIPPGHPRRYRNSAGYVRLRWKIGPQQYVEEYEHRIAAGRPDSGMHVHHLNGVKDDNRPENLEVLTREEHARRHPENIVRCVESRGGAIGARKNAPYRSGAAKAKAENAARRRSERAAEVAWMRELYRGGASTVEIGKIVGIDPSNVLRRLTAAGVVMRERRRPAGNRSGERQAREIVAARSAGLCEACGLIEAQEWHHRKNRSQGGKWHPANGLHLCRPCHRQITENPAEAHDLGWAVKSFENPAERICSYRGQWALLDDAGQVSPVERVRHEMTTAEWIEEDTRIERMLDAAS